MEFFAVLICCAIAAALGFFIGATMYTSKLVTLTIENRKLREPIKNELQEVTAQNRVTTYTLRDGTEITFDRSKAVVTIHRGES